MNHVNHKPLISKHQHSISTSVYLLGPVNKQQQFNPFCFYHSINTTKFKFQFCTQVQSTVITSSQSICKASTWSILQEPQICCKTIPNLNIDLSTKHQTIIIHLPQTSLYHSIKIQMPFQFNISVLFHQIFNTFFFSSTQYCKSQQQELHYCH